MTISLRPRNVRRYREIARLLVKYGRGDLVRQAGFEDLLDGEPLPDAAAVGPDREEAEALAADLERLGPTFVKLGQLLSTRADLLPAPYLDALARLQDKVEPFPFEEVERIVTEELGVRMSRAFSDFDAHPMAAASLAQVHRAALRDGRAVAVKVQRPDIRGQIVEDLEALGEIAEFLDRRTDLGRRYGFGPMLEEFRRSLVDELDYRREAQNLEMLRQQLADYDRIVVPRPVADYTTSRVLTMELVRGRKLTSLGPLAQLELEGAQLADQLFRAYLDQILVHGLVHADPHPGNVVLTDDGRLALLDLGMVTRLGAGTQERLVKLLLAISDGRAEESAEIAIALGEPREVFDEGQFRRRVGEVVTRHQGVLLGDIKAGSIVVELSRISGEAGLRPPPELTMLGKALLNLDAVAATLDPAYDPNAAIRRHAVSLLEARVRRSVSPGSVFSAALDAKEFVEQIPGRVNRVMDALARGELRINVSGIDERQLLRGLRQMANRLTLGLVIAALIVGAAMLVRVDTEARLFGYPAIAIVCFLVAAVGALALVVAILVGDRR